MEVRTSSRRWPQALATALVVLVAAGAATTFLALRSSRQGGSPAGSIGAPPARTGAAITYDSTSGLTVMFGGVSGGGQALTDTWTWDGSGWTSAARGPGALTGARLVDDPADGGVLLIGAPTPPTGDGVVGTGCSGGGVAVPGSAGGTAAAVSAAASAAVSKPAPPVGQVPTDPVGSPGSTVATPPAVVCPPVTAPPAVQTWLFNSSGWHRAASGSVAATPPAGADLSFDQTTRQVVAVSAPAFSCGPPLRSSAAIACPLAGSGTGKQALAPDPAPCDVAAGCLPTPTISTWAWSNGSWKAVTANQALPYLGTVLVFEDPATQHATLMTVVSPYNGATSNGATSYPCAVNASSCATLRRPLTTTSTWTGSGWRQVSQVPTT
ncbi:MAG TPA: hypothetical protein VLO10_00850, partial [Candidatus Deferrimicrobium sp.]|nr:hypothetical protein [Candidatus Deferrimicrobium sp.]